MNTRNWKSGPPPHFGWWNASRDMDSRAWRWWDGVQWSGVTFAGLDGSYARQAALQLDHGPTGSIHWSDYYPEDARVPRIDPSLPVNRVLVEFLNNGNPRLIETVWKVMSKREEMAALTPEERDATRAHSRTVREMKTRVRPTSTGQMPNTVAPHTVELMDIPAKALLQELLRRQL